MSRNSRLAWLAAAVVVAVAAFVLLRPSDDHRDLPPLPGKATSEDLGASNNGRRSDRGARRPLRVVVKGKQPVGGVKELDVHKGERVRFTVTSDQPEEIHTHGYDIAKEVGPGESARFDFRARIEGVFEVELENSGVQIMKLTVEP